jgi:type II secretory pathway pseudopilin PulG
MKRYLRKTIFKGFTLIELLVVMGIFIIITTVVVSILVIVLRGTNKSDSIVIVRQNGENAMAQMVRMMRFAKSIDCTGAPSVPSSVVITSFDLGQTTFSCPVTFTPPNFIASTSAILTTVPLTNSSTVAVDSCSFVCTQSSGGPSAIGITFTLSKIGSNGLAEGNATIPFQTSVTMRNFDSQ